MSTRSGKRIHSSFEKIPDPDMNQVEFKSERKTRSKRRKENTDDSNAALNKTTHYVHYPGDDALKDDVKKSSRKLRRHTLKEHNEQNTDDNVDMEKPRHTRKTKRFVQGNEFDTAENNELGEKEVMECPIKIKKNKKKKENIIVEPIVNIKETVPKGKKQSKKKKHLKVVDATKENFQNSTLNKSVASIDSFHSAAGSPESVKPDGILCQLIYNTASDKDTSDALQKPKKKSVTPKVSKRKNSTNVKDSDADCRTINVIAEKESTKKRKSTRNKKSIDQTVDLHRPIEIDCPAKNVRAKKTDISFDSSNTKANVTFEKSNQDINNTYEKAEEKLNSTFDKSSPKLNHTLEKTNHKLNGTFDKASDDNFVSKCKTNGEVFKTESSKRKLLETVTNNESPMKHSLNSTFEKSPNKLNKTKSLDATFNKENDGESLPINDQVQNKNKKSDCINTTIDKSKNDSHISIDSDDSKTENIINTTPQLIESSMEESGMDNSSKKITPQSSVEKRKEVAVTPLKREGTYIKDSPKVQTPKTQEPATPKSRETRLSMNVTPNRRKSLPSPGRTPFPGSKTSEKKNNILNVTHSIEKSMPRTSISEPIPRMTKVMFCSPIHNPVVASQMKRKVIKSNLKGSNKSFVFDDSMSDTRRSVNRKRSYTQSEAETVQSKRTRLGEEMQQSINRLSRPRTVSATAKLSEPSTPSKTMTPTKCRPEAKVSRTKLPNFAALHQKRFEKMESLDECLERKANRARQLLTPTGSVNLMERVSPKEKAVDSPKSSQSKEPKKHTLESLNPGYTRFGFRMKCEADPFTKQTEVKERKPNGLKRQATVPSLTGVTSLRREAAKQTVMREKSFTDKRNTNRNENRTVIKGVRTNRRFELQMRMRNII